MLRVNLALAVVALAYPALFLFFGGWDVGGAVLVGIFTVPISVFVGIPLVAWFLRHGWFALWQALLAGAFAGLVLLCAMYFLFGGMLSAALPVMTVGALHGFVFWMIAFWRNTAIRCFENGAKSVV
jgi:hypothetical protein